ncbi:MAG: caspase family protein [Clostridiales bacterium]|nr:caspase family protein [Clostridiales bacterium]
MVKALLVGVSEYNINGYTNLPYCKNDILELRKSLISGLKISPDNITLLGCDKTVYEEVFELLLDDFLASSKKDDIIIIYFSGHGNKGDLIFSNKVHAINETIIKIESCLAKSKIIILDCCNSCNFILDGVAQLSTENSITEFVGKGCTIMASCGSNQTSGSHPNRDISLYTSFLCDAIKEPLTIREGKKSLEDINNSIKLYSKIWNEHHKNQIREPIYRSNMGGTIFFDAEEYHPYISRTIYQDNEEYTITDVEPLHHATAKRYAIKVKLKRPCTYDMIADIVQRIVSTAKYYEIYNNINFEKIHRNKPANIIWCYFGNDEEDMVNCNYFCRTTWVDDTQDKSYWYKDNKDSLLINDIYIQPHSWYELCKKLSECTISREELIDKTKECTSNLISVAERYIQLFHEFENKTFSENTFTKLVQPLNRKLAKWYFIQGDLPVAPIELHDWAEANIQIVNTIHDLSLFYNEDSINTWNSDNKRWLVQNTIDKYTKELEVLKKFNV